MKTNLLWMMIAAWTAARIVWLDAAEPNASVNPADQLPPHIKRVTWFGERADWSHDGKKILFLSKTFGDAMELDLATKQIRNLTAHYPHHGYTRALYLQNGDILLSGPQAFDPKRAGEARVQCWLWMLDKSLTKPAQPLGTKCSEGPAVSRRRMHIAWTHVAAQYPDEMPARSSRMLEADLIVENGAPKLVNQRVIITSADLPFQCTLETQNFRPPAEQEITFSAYGYQGTEVGGVDLATKKVVNYSNAPGQYDEPEGIFPDGNFTLVECDKQNLQGPGHVDLWKLKLDGSGQYERLTSFSDVPGYKASNPVVSDDGKFIAFQLAKSRDAAGVGHGIFILDLTAAPASNPKAGGTTAAYQVAPDFPQLPQNLKLAAASGVATDADGNVLVFHRGEPHLLVFSASGKFLRPFSDQKFNSAHGLRVDPEGSVWVTDNGNHTVTKFSAAGKVLMTLGEKDVPGEDETHFNKPADIAFAANGDFYVADGYGNSRVVKFDRNGKFLLAWGRKGTAPGEFNLPHAVQVDASGRVFVGDRENNRIQVFDAQGKFLRQFGGFAPFGLFMTSDQTLFVADGRANQVMKMTLEGKVIEAWGTMGSEPGNFLLPHGITVDRHGAVYVTEINGRRVQKFLRK
ncbi:MAG: 6-bladed beta-propeller [Verrucomicrobiota bacterium]